MRLFSNLLVGKSMEGGGSSYSDKPAPLYHNIIPPVKVRCFSKFPRCGQKTPDKEL